MGEGGSEAEFFNVLGPDRVGIEQSVKRSYALHLLSEEGYGKPIVIHGLQPKRSLEEGIQDPDAFSLATVLTQVGHVVLCQNGRLVEVSIPQHNRERAQAYIDSFAASQFVAHPRPIEYPAGQGSHVTTIEELVLFYEREGWVKNDSRFVGVEPFKDIVKNAIAISSDLRRRPSVIQARVFRAVYDGFLRGRPGQQPPPTEGPTSI